MSVDGVLRLCRAHEGDERPLRIALIEELGHPVPFGAYVWAVTDPATGVAASPLADVPEAAVFDLPRLIRSRYLTTVNRWTTLAGPVDSLRRATGGELDRSLLHREVLGDLGVIDVASAVCRDRHGCWSWFDLWRFDGAEPFSDAELAELGRVVAPITETLRRCLARTFDDPAPTPERTGPAVLFLSADLRVIGQTPETDGYLRALLPPEADRRPIPAAAYNVAAQLLAVEAGVDDNRPSTRVHFGRGVWLTLRAGRVDGAEGDIAVTIEPTSPAERRDLLARSHALSPRETELLDHLAEGADTRALAEVMFLSENTVQDHLKSIFAKTGARNRRTLMARLSGR